MRKLVSTKVLQKNNWTDLFAKEQTALFGKKYNVGHVDAGLARAVANYDRPTVLKDLAGSRGEGPYMAAYYKREDAAGTPRAKAYAAARAAKAAKLPAKVPTVVGDSTKVAKLLPQVVRDSTKTRP